MSILLLQIGRLIGALIPLYLTVIRRLVRLIKGNPVYRLLIGPVDRRIIFRCCMDLYEYHDIQRHYKYQEDHGKDLIPAQCAEIIESMQQGCGQPPEPEVILLLLRVTCHLIELRESVVVPHIDPEGCMSRNRRDGTEECRSCPILHHIQDIFHQRKSQGYKNRIDDTVEGIIEISVFPCSQPECQEFSRFLHHGNTQKCRHCDPHQPVCIAESRIDEIHGELFSEKCKDHGERSESPAFDKKSYRFPLMLISGIDKDHQYDRRYHREQKQKPAEL